MKMIKSNSYRLLLLSALLFNSANVLYGSFEPNNENLETVKPIDTELNNYYKDEGEPYLNEYDTKGKFLSHCEDYGISDSDIKEIFNDNSDSSNLFKKSHLIKFDKNFPIPKECQNQDEEETIFQILKNIYQNKKPLDGMLPRKFYSNERCFEECFDNKKRQLLLLFGYLREQQTKLNISIPLDVEKYILKLYNTGCIPCEHVQYDWFSQFNSSKEETDFKEISMILQEYDIVDAQDRYNDDGDTALIKAVKRKSIKIATFLLQHRANVNTINYCGFSPLCIACKGRDMEMVELLLEHNAISM